MPKVLIADDSLSVRKVAERLLVAAGFDVALAANGEEALASLAATNPDVIIADVIMPDKSGFEVCAHIRSHATCSAIPVLLISGVVDDEITRQAVACGANGVIKKPFHGTSLQDRVLALLPSRHRQPEVTLPLPIETAAFIETEHMAGAGLAAKVFRMTEDQLEKARDIAAWAKDVEARLSKEQKRAGELEEQNAAFRETAISTAAHVRELEMELSEEQKRSSMLQQRVAETEHAAACAYRLAEIVAEIGRLGPKP